MRASLQRQEVPAPSGADQPILLPLPSHRLESAQTRADEKDGKIAVLERDLAAERARKLAEEDAQEGALKKEVAALEVKLSAMRAAQEARNEIET